MSAHAGVLSRLARPASRRNRVLVAITTSSLCASLLVAVPFAPQAAHASTHHVARHVAAGVSEPAPVTNQPSTLVASAHGDIAALRTASTQTFPVGNGQYQEDLFSVPVNYQAQDKSWQPIDTTLAPAGSTASATTAGTVVTTLPNDLSTAPVTVSDGTHTIGLQLLNAATGAGTVSKSTETWAGVLPGVTAALTDETNGVKENLTLASAAATSVFAYTLTVSAGMTPAVNASGGVTISSAGSTVATIPPAIMDDASKTATGHSSAVAYTLVPVTATTWTLTMTPSATWLADAARVFPVIIDPTVYVAGPGAVVCGIVSSSATTGHCPDLTFGVGTNSGTYRAVGYWPALTTTVPLDSVITEADFFPYATSSLNGTTQTVAVYQLTRPFTSGVTWNTYDGTNAWTTAGGDYTSAYSYGYAALPPGANARQSIPFTNLVQQWVNGQLPNNGALIKVNSEPGSNLDNFNSSSNTSNVPELKVTYQARFGSAASASFTTRGITDRQKLSVNNANGNLVIDATDLNLAAVGIRTNVSHTYNSRRSDQPSTLGYGWVYDTGRDVRAYLDPSNNITYVAPGGVYYIFGAHGTSYTDANGANASVTYAAGQVTLTQHASQEVDVFNTDGTLHTRTDRNGNAQTFTYDASIFTGDGLPYLDSIADTAGRTLTFTKTYNQAGVGDGSGRAVTYGYSGNKLTTFVDGWHQTTTYGYDTSSRVNTILDPRGNTYTISYDSIGRVTGLADPGGSCSGTVSKCTTFAYTDPTVPGSTGGTGMLGTTVVTDPLGHATTYTWDNQDRVTKVLDPLGHSRATSWTANSDQATLTDGAVIGNVTTNTYDTLNNATQTQAPDVAGGSSGSGRLAKLGYPTATGSSPYAGADYLPTSSTDTEGNNPTTMAYDTTGNLMTVTPPSGSGGVALNYSYQGDSGVTSCGGHNGQLCKSTDGNGHATTYSYNGSPKYQLTSTTQPAPLGTTTLTYDTLGRVATSTDAKMQTTTYSYDGDDHITEVQYGGITTCTTADISAGNCQTYGYDNNGNLQTRVDATGTTTFGYTPRNQVNSKAIPGQTTNSTTAYDDAGNVVTYADAGGTVSYVYDPANQLWALSEPGGSCPAYSATTPVTIPNTTRCTAFTVNYNGARTKIAYPSGETINYSIENSGRISAMNAYHNGSSTAFFARTLSYTSAVGSKDRSQVQSSVDGVGTTVTSTYGYDVYQRLTSDAVGSTTYGYTYDQTGNRLTSTKTGSSQQYYGYNNANQLCWSGTTSGTNGTTTCPTTPTGDTAYTYDNNGNQLTGGPGGTASYNNQNQTTQNVVSGTTTTLAYAGGGQTERTAVGATTLINGLEGLVGQTNGTSIYFTRDPNGDPISLRQGAGGTSVNSYYLLDQQASVLRLTAADGTTDNATYTYDPYGTTLTAVGTLATTNPYRYATSYYDTATGLYKLGARNYDPSVGRFTQPDPSGRELNTYFYAADNPVNSIDPSGNKHTQLTYNQTDALIGELTAATLTVAALAGIFGLLPGGQVTALLLIIVTLVVGVLADAINTEFTHQPPRCPYFNSHSFFGVTFVSSFGFNDC